MNKPLRFHLLLPYVSLLIALCLGYEPLYAQDSIKTQRIDSLISLAKDLIEKDNDKSKELLDIAKEQSDKIGYWQGVALTLKNYGVLEDISGNTEGAQSYYDQTLDLYERHGVSDDRYNDILLNKGVAYYLSGQNDLALEHYLLAYQGYYQSGNNKRISSVLNNLGIIYREKEDYKLARKSYFESYNLKLALGDSLGGAKNLNNIALLYGYEEEIDSSIHYFARSKELFTKNGYGGNAQLVNLDLGQTYYIAKDYDNAISLLKEILESEVIDYASAKQRIGGILALSESYRKKANLAEAHNLLSKNMGYIENHGTKSDLADVYLSHSETYAAKKEYNQAYKYLDKHKDLQEELVANSRLKYEEEMTASFNLLGKENELKTQELKLADQLKTRDRLIAGVTLISILSTLLYVLLRTKNKLNSDLANKNIMLNKAVSEKNVLLKEIHHRVKNNLQIISSLLNLQRRYQSNEKTSAAFLEGQNRVKSMSMIHQLLYQEDQLTSINTKTYTDKLVQSLRAAYKMSSSSLTFFNKVEEITLDVDTMIPIGLVLNELVTNAFKYAYKNRNHGILGIELKKMDHHLALKVYDDGPGFPKEFNIEETNSFGYKLIHSLGRKLEATLTFENKEYNTVIVTIKNYKTAS